MFLFMRQSTVALGRISAFLARAVHTWKYGTLFSEGFVSGSSTSCVWVLLEEYQMNSVVIRAMLGSTVNTCSASVCDASGWTRILRWQDFMHELHVAGRVHDDG